MQRYTAGSTCPQWGTVRRTIPGLSHKAAGRRNCNCKWMREAVRASLQSTLNKRWAKEPPRPNYWTMDYARHAATSVKRKSLVYEN